MHGYTHDKEIYLQRLRRIEGQVRGRLEDHLAHSVTQALAEGGDSADEKVREASAAIARLVRS